ncbi:MAG: LPS assembly protein LptD [Proteobacteria bacterium]|nr:LPS assembly protein LptD [Pseudomonadota bacterium]
MLPLAAAALLAASPALAQHKAPRPAAPAASAASSPASAPAAAADGPVQIEAREIRGRPDIDAVAEGQVELRRGPLELQSDWLSYEQAQDLAIARGHVRVRNAIGRFSGPELQLQLDRFEGFFLQPAYEIDRVQAGGRAARIDFIDDKRSVAREAWYTSCPREDGDRPAWVLKADRVQLDFEANEGVAAGAVLRFMDVPILALPTLSFPIGEGRKSGWLPPTLDFDTKSGLSLAVPYYWNIAPNRDATLTPRLITRRGVALGSEFRYLEPAFGGRVNTELLPDDRVAGRSRWALDLEHQGSVLDHGRWRADVLRVSDDAWWKDFPKATARSLNPRLLPQRLEAEYDLDSAWWDRGEAYARVLRWQVLQDSDLLVVSPYEREPQLGLQFNGERAGWRYALQTEANRFVLPDREGSTAEPTGWRAHVLGSLSRPWRQPGMWVVPRVSVNAASYALDEAMSDGRRNASRLIPTFSVEGGLEFERPIDWFGRKLRQTLEPRLLYVNTPFRDQSALPNFDSAGKDFNFDSMFSDNAFSGIDRVSDSHQITAGVISRLLDDNGAEAMRVGMAQRYLLRTQRITPEGPPLSQRFSDLYLLGAASLAHGISVDGALQYSTDIQRPVRTVASARWSPGEFRTIGATYRLTRGSTEQLELAWQWPVWKSAAGPAAAAGGGGHRSSNTCGGTWYTVGRVNYSLRDSRVTDSILGLEYDAGCWIMRVVAERLSTGRSEATTHIQLQLELVGLSRLGSNPLKVLKDNIPGYRLLREEPSETTPAPPRYD